MIDVAPLRLVSEGPANPGREPIVSGVPFTKGEVFDVDILRLVDVDGEVVPAYFCIAAKWPDGSIKWVHLYFQAEGSNADTGQLYIKAIGQIETNTKISEQHPGIKVEASGDKLTVSTGEAVFDIREKDLGPLTRFTMMAISSLMVMEVRLG